MITVDDLWAAHEALDAIKYGLDTAADDRLEDDPIADLWEESEPNDLIDMVRAVLPERHLLPPRAGRRRQEN